MTDEDVDMGIGGDVKLKKKHVEKRGKIHQWNMSTIIMVVELFREREM